MHRPLTPSDLLITQPTSITSKINLDYIVQFLDHLMPEDDWEIEFDKLKIECKHISISHLFVCSCVFYIQTFDMKFILCIRLEITVA